ncbi:MAG TPA: type II toxin-antitoxin system VapC family toxin [Mesorhizobium sp.]
MRILLDTHVAIWALTQPRLIPDRIGSVIKEEETSVFVSVAVIWEIAIKSSLNRASAPDVDAARIVQMCNDAAYEIVPVTPAHAVAVASLPHIHADPFDRIMIAQAIIEPMRLVTHDKVVAAYDKNFLSW